MKREASVKTTNAGFGISSDQATSNQKQSNLPSYVLLTAARDEVMYIEETLRSVASQTVLPLRWIVVSNGSKDGTETIVRQYSAQYSWIRLERLEGIRQRSFAAKARSINTGYCGFADLNFDLVGIIDADISFAADFFEFLLRKFPESENLGIAGTRYIEESYSSANHSFSDLTYVAGQCQLFRRACFEDIGGYLPLEEGGIDTVAVMMAKSRGWNTRTFVEKSCIHNRRTSANKGGVLSAAFQDGWRDYLLDNHPLWEMARCAFCLNRSPYFLWSASLLCGYVSAFLGSREKSMPAECGQLQRREQLQRLKQIYATLGK